MKPNTTPEKTPAKLVWMDLEMTGLDPERDSIIEMATLITDSNLNILAEGPEIVIHQPEERFQLMDDWNKEHHTKSGLWAKVITSKISLKEAEDMTLNFIKAHTPSKESPLCGNTIWQDRRFLVKHMAALEDYLHYRLVDVSTIKELAFRWYPGIKFKKPKGSHRALDDIKESIEELRFYQENFFRTKEDVFARIPPLP